MIYHPFCSQIFQGNWDRNTVVYNVLTPVISARYVRILPKTWISHACMRAEFYTCEYGKYQIDSVITLLLLVNFSILLD